MLSFGTGCGEEARTEAVGSHQHVARTGGGAVALSYDERIAVVTNRSAGIVTVVTLKPERGLQRLVTRTEALSVGAESEPWAAVVGADDDTAFVILRKTQQVIRIDELRNNPHVAEHEVSVGSEPMGIAISPSGKMLFVANWGEGTISKIDVPTFEFLRTLDLNQTLVDKEILGDGLRARLGLAHPRALVITDNGDENDDDETMFATEFFSQPIPRSTREISEVDRNREGLVYSWDLGRGQPGPAMEISPVADTGFPDSKGNPTGCFPNQLYAAAIDGDRLYVTAMCTSPRGPLDKDGESSANFKTLLHPAVFVLNVKTKEELPEEGRLLTQVLQSQFDAVGGVTDARMPLIPNDIAVRTGTNGDREAYVLALGADAVFRLDYGAEGALHSIGSPAHPFIGSLPEHGYSVGLAVTRRSSTAFGLSLSDVTQELSVLDLAQEVALQDRIPMTTGHAEALRVHDSFVNEGRGLFATGRGVWSFKGQAWSSCESCHPGGLSDGVVWYFSRGPRRTLSAANTYEKGVPEGQEPRRRLLLWGANVDEVHDVEGIVRTVSGGVGAMVWQYVSIDAPSSDCRIVYDGKGVPKGSGTGLCKQAKPTSELRNGLNGSLSPIANGQGCGPNDVSCDSSLNQDWQRIDAFIRALRVPQPPAQLDISHVNAGREVFKRGRCANCHGGPLWTTSNLFYAPGDEANGKAPVLADGATPPADLAAALGRLRTSTYSVPVSYQTLNPLAKVDLTQCPTGEPCTTHRAKPDGADDAAALKLLYGIDATSTDPRGDAAKAAGGDQLRCALRNVGTFPTQPLAPEPAVFDGITPLGAPTPKEYRADMTTLAQGKDGFGPPSLLGLAVGAPYLHAGNARTLDEVFNARFKEHFANPALGVPPGFLSNETDVQYLIEFLLSLDETTPTEDIPADADFCTYLPGPAR